MMSDMHDDASIKAESIRIIRALGASKFYPYVGTIEATGDRRPVSFAKRDAARVWTEREATTWISAQSDPSEYSAEDPAERLSHGLAFEIQAR